MKRNMFLFSIATVLLLLGLSMLQMIGNSMVDLLFYFALFCSTLLGIAHVIGMNRLGYPQRSRIFGFRFLVTIVIMVFSVGLGFILYRLAGLNAWFLTFNLVFLVPYLVWHAFLSFYRIGRGLTIEKTPAHTPNISKGATSKKDV